ncbi:hypothetical protein C0Q70_19802 [Pomacea canaliculata]|uniref:Uncharacterized protein n=1 Tax=Pomacea canaliculata TaxID=400727 RepID=A0A2T7NDU2_POMCA|nr:hypothetical protein C0Q70_19802 [Pomacea canaliculata]
MSKVLPASGGFNWVEPSTSTRSTQRYSNLFDMCSHICGYLILTFIPSRGAYPSFILKASVVFYEHTWSRQVVEDDERAPSLGVAASLHAHCLSSHPAERCVKRASTAGLLQARAARTNAVPQG